MIYSSPPAKVYIGGKLKGETPYQHKDMRLTFMSRKIRLEQNGYKPLNDKIRRSERVGKLAVFFTLTFWLPALWIGHYDPYHAYVLTPTNSSEKYKTNFIKYKEPVKLKSRISNPIYIGKGDKYHYVYHNNQLSTFSKSFQHRSTETVFEGRDSPSLIPIDGFVNDGKKVIIAQMNGKLSAVTINKSGKSSFVKLISIIENQDIICPEYKYGYARSVNGNEFIAYDDNSLTVYDFGFNVKNKFSSKGSILEAEITSDGRVFSLEATESEVYFVKKGSNGKKVSVVLVKDRNMNFFRLNINEKLNKAYVSYLVSPKANKATMTKREKRRADSQSFVSEGVYYIEYDLGTMKQLTSKTIFFEEDVVSKADYTANGGIKYLINRGVESTEKATFITLEEQYIVVVTNEHGSKEVLNAKGIIAINAKKQSNPMVYVPKRGLSSYEFQRLSFNQIVKGDKIHFLFNDNIAIGTAPAIQQIVLDSDLNYLSQDVFNLYKEGKTLLNTADSYELEDGTRLIFHMRKKRLGAAIISFE